jgi:hypothetical protein
MRIANVIGNGVRSATANRHSVRITDHAKLKQSQARWLNNRIAKGDPYIRVELIPSIAAPDRQIGDTSFAYPAVK